VPLRVMLIHFLIASSSYSLILNFNPSQYRIYSTIIVTISVTFCLNMRYHTQVYHPHTIVCFTLYLVCE